MISCNLHTLNKHSAVSTRFRNSFVGIPLLNNLAKVGPMHLRMRLHVEHFV